MIDNLFGNFFNKVSIFDSIVILIIVYFSIQCYLKGFSLSLISFMKWVLTTVITIIIVPKLQPTVKDYIESEFINNVGLGIAVFFITLFTTTSFLYNLRMFSLTINLFLDFLTSILLVLLMGNKRLTTELV